MPTEIATPGIEERFDPLSDEYLADPYPFLAEARRAAPAFFCASIGHWVVSRYPDVRHVLRTPADFSAVNANSPLVPPCPRAAEALARYGAVPTLANVDPPVHTRARRMANSAFTPRRVAAMEPVVRDIVVRFCEQRLRIGHADLVADFARELPVVVLFTILGVPEEDVERVKTGSWNRILCVYGHPDEDTQIEAAEGMATFWQYAVDLVEDRRRNQRGDFTSDLVRAQDQDGVTFTAAEAATVALNLLFAGHETTTGLLGNAFRRLLEHRRAWDDLCDDPGLIPNAVEEVLRFDSSVIAWRRRARRAVSIGEVDVPPESNLLLLLGAANRDPNVFDDPDRFDIHRPNAADHLSFGAGPHFCLGASLARLQARVVLEEVSRRLPSLRLVPGTELTFAPNVSFRGPLSLPAEWDTKRDDSARDSIGSPPDLHTFSTRAPDSEITR